MDRLTHERCSGIKSGYWSPEKKEDLINRLAEYENTGLTPKEIIALKDLGWISILEQLPENNNYILLSFTNFTLPMIGRYEKDTDGRGTFYIGDEEKSCIDQDLYVNAWRPLPEPYRGKA